MQLELQEITIPTSKIMQGLVEFNMVAGQSLKIETSPSGVEILEQEVPAGKLWTAYLTLKLVETDA